MHFYNYARRILSLNGHKKLLGAPSKKQIQKEQRECQWQLPENRNSLN